MSIRLSLGLAFASSATFMATIAAVCAHALPGSHRSYDPTLSDRAALADRIEHLSVWEGA